MEKKRTFCISIEMEWVSLQAAIHYICVSFLFFSLFIHWCVYGSWKWECHWFIKDDDQSPNNMGLDWQWKKMSKIEYFQRQPKLNEIKRRTCDEKARMKSGSFLSAHGTMSTSIKLTHKNNIVWQFIFVHFRRIPYSLSPSLRCDWHALSLYKTVYPNGKVYREMRVRMRVYVYAMGRCSKNNKILSSKISCQK